MNMHVSQLAASALRPSIRDLMARKVIAEDAWRNCATDTGPELEEADLANVAAQEMLMAFLGELTGLERTELRELAGMMW